MLLPTNIGACQLVGLHVLSRTSVRSSFCNSQKTRSHKYSLSFQQSPIHGIADDRCKVPWIKSPHVKAKKKLPRYARFVTTSKK